MIKIINYKFILDFIKFCKYIKRVNVKVCLENDLRL
jgi:hypothetical protein